MIVGANEGGKGLLRHDNKAAPFAKDSDMLFSESTLSLGGSVKGCLPRHRKPGGPLA